MYIPIDREITLKIGENEKVRAIAQCPIAKLVAVATDDWISIWSERPQYLIHSCPAFDKGNFKDCEIRNIYWRPDSQRIAVTTNQNQIFIYNVVDHSGTPCYNFRDTRDVDFQRKSRELFQKCDLMRVQLQPGIVVNLADVPTSLVVGNEDMRVFLKNGFVHLISWNGELNSEYSYRIGNVEFSNDQIYSKTEKIVPTDGTQSLFVKSAKFAPLLGGFCAVLSDGRAILLKSTDVEFLPKNIIGIWMQNLKDATCCDINHKFMLLYFGCANGDICAYTTDEQTGAFFQVFRVSPKVTNGPDFTNRLGPVTNIQLTMSGFGVVAIWGRKENLADDVHPLPKLYAVFTTFGAQTFCNLEGIVAEKLGDSENAENEYTTMGWGRDGLQIWLGTRNGIRIQDFVRSASLNSPIMEHCERAVLIGHEQILIGPDRKRESDAIAPHSVWDHVTVAHDYISANWPIRLATIDKACNHLVVSGEHGFAYYSLSSKKWKLFGNESQEKDIQVSAVFIWKDAFICAVEKFGNNLNSRLAFYPLNQKLDCSNASITELEYPCTLAAVRKNVIAVFDIEYQINLLTMEAHMDPNGMHKVSTELVSIVKLNELLVHPANMVSFQVTRFNLEVGGHKARAFCSDIDSILVNASGKLLVLSIDESGTMHTPIVIATHVERIWNEQCEEVVKRKIFEETSKGWNKGMRRKEEEDFEERAAAENSNFLDKALWIACGAQGIKVWIPLISKKTAPSQEMTFIAKRIMIKFELDIYPIVICAKDCLAIGVESQFQHVAKPGKDRNIFTYGLHRNSEVFVHHLLRQLLKRNLGLFALELAASCRSLPHFSHALELLLHGVLEEEATSSEPIPDPLLPRCIAFIHEFPEFLKTVAHCARKTELALWPTLFDVTGSPTALFEECLNNEQLENAASYVIVLQNFESTEKCMEQAARLIKAALVAKKYTIAREMVRFAKSIGAEDIDATISPPPSAKTSISRRPTVSSHGENEPGVNRFQAGGPARLSKVRHSQNAEMKETQRKDSTGSSKNALSRATSSEFPAAAASAATSPTSTNRLALKMNAIIEEHCWHLLNNYYILDLGFFCTELQIELSSFLEVRRKYVLIQPKAAANENCYMIDDFPLALTRLHAQFQWPYPVIAAQFVHQIEKKLGSLRSSQSSASLNGVAQNSETLSNASTVIETQPTSTEKVKLTRDYRKLKNLKELVDDDEEVTIEQVLLELENGETFETEKSYAVRRNPSVLTDDPTTSSSEIGSLAGDWQGADYLGGQKLSKANTESRRQIEYMLQLFVNSSAIDWIFLICLLCRDERRLRQELNVQLIKKVGEKNFARIRHACAELARWAVEKCCGYVSLIQSFDAHLTIIAEMAGIADLKWAEPEFRRSAEKPKLERNARNGSSSVVNGSFAAVNRRERSRSVDRVDRAVRRYDDVVCAEDALEKADQDGCQIM